jgi:tetratricopeptide (TPR) repeat protein
MFDRHEHQTTALHQSNSGGGDNVGRDKIIHNHLHGSVDYQQLAEAIRDKEELLAGIAPERTDLRQKHAAKLNELRKQLEDFKAEVFRLHELFTRIPINNERLRRAKAHFDRGEFREADAVLKAEEINAEVAQLKLEERTAEDRLAAVRKDLADKANEFLLKAQLSLLNPAVAGESRFTRTEQYFEQALAAARTAEVLFDYALFLQEHNAFRRAEPLYQEALKYYRSRAEENPEAFLPDVARTLNNLAVLHSDQNAFSPALTAYEEALQIRRSLAAASPEAFLPDVADTLNNLARLHYAQNAFSPAWAAYEGALKLYRSLAEASPEAFLPKVAMTLNNLGILHKAQNAFGPALAAYEEALTSYRSVAETNPEAFLPDVAMTLNNLAALHYTQNDFGPALAEYEEALKIRRSLAKENPEAFLPNVAATLINLSIFYLKAVPDRAKSVAYAEEARSILVPLCAKMPHLQEYLDTAARLLADNSAKPAA